MTMKSTSASKTTCNKSTKMKMSSNLRTTLRNELRMGGMGHTKSRSLKSFDRVSSSNSSNVVTFELMDRWSSSASQLSFTNLTDACSDNNEDDDESCKNFLWGFNSAPDLAYNEDFDYNCKRQRETITSTLEEVRVDSCPIQPGRRTSLLATSTLPATEDDDSEKNISHSKNNTAADASLRETLHSCMTNTHGLPSSSSTFIQRKKGVSFLAKDSIIPYASLDEYTSKELKACWYSKQDLVDVEATNIQLVKRMKQGQPPLKGHCFRGLEDYRDETTVAIALSSTNVSSTSSPRHNEIMMTLCHRHNQLHRDAVSIVLDYVAKTCKTTKDVQKSRHHQFNDEVLSALYRNASQKHKLLALTAGWKDEREAKNLYSDDAALDMGNERTEVAATTTAPASPNKTLHVGHTNTVLIVNKQERQETKRWTHLVTTPAA